MTWYDLDLPPVIEWRRKLLEETPRYKMIAASALDLAWLDGDILVAAITTPAWTPLFAMAAAIVTDVGGSFSHGSIVAREYGIPAVLGTGAATRRIHSGQTITVDGTAGEVILA